MKKTEDRPPLLLSLREVADALGIGVRSLHRHIKAKRFPKPIRIGGTLRFSRKSIAQWISSQSKEVGDE
jgi:predicted DNA-binding transcriptional regulator AlpA